MFSCAIRDNKAGFSRVKPANQPRRKKNSMVFYQKREMKQYDMMEIINRLVDNSEFEPYKDGYGQTIITGYED
jgi:acetyl-CoA carboxylase carboxyltransferase component